MNLNLLEPQATLDRSDWKSVRFGDVVRNCKETVDPETSGLERYVAGEHMESDDLRIRRWGTIGDGYLGPAFHRKFVAGQVLYGSRRTYLRKVAIAHFDGVCANTTFVLEPASDDLTPELLPFIMQTERFTNHSVKNSKGSVNPYVNWKDIASYEFALPPMAEQRRIAEVLWAAEHAIRQALKVQDSLTRLEDSTIQDFLGNGRASPEQVSAGWQLIQCEKLLLDQPRNGVSPRANASFEGFPTLSISAIRGGRVIAEGNTKFAEISEQELQRYRLFENDVLVVRGNGNRSLVGRCGIVEQLPLDCFYPDLLIRLVFDPSKIIPEFACIQWNAASVHARLIEKAKSSNGIWKINGQDVRGHYLHVPPLGNQQAFVDLLGSIRRGSAQAVEQTMRSKELKRSLLQFLLNPCPEAGDV